MSNYAYLKEKAYVPYCAQSALCFTVIPHNDGLYRIESIQYDTFACNIRNSKIKWYRELPGVCGPYVWNHWLRHLKYDWHDEQCIMNRKVPWRKTRWLNRGYCSGIWVVGSLCDITTSIHCSACANVTNSSRSIYHLMRWNQPPYCVKQPCTAIYELVQSTVSVTAIVGLWQHNWTAVLRRVCKTAWAVISFVMSVRTEILDFHWTDVREIWYLSIFR
jgi:hypothetical protein